MGNAPVAWFVIVLALGLASRPIELRLWRSGRISGRTLMYLWIARFPVMVGVLGLIAGASLPVIALVEVLLVLPTLLAYQLFRHLVGDGSVGEDPSRRTGP